MIQSILFIIVESSLLFLVFLVYFKAPENKINRLFSKFYFIAALWGCFNYLESAFKNPILDTLFLRLDFMLAPLLFYYYLIFCLNFPEPVNIDGHRKTALLAPVFFLSLLSFSDLIIKDIELITQGIQFKWSLLYVPYGIVLFSYAAYGSANLILKIRQYKGRQRLQIYYVLLGISIAAFPGLITNLILTQLFHLPLLLSRIGVYLLVIPSTFTAYAIIRYYLMDIKIVITRAGIFSFVYLLALGIPFIIGAFLKSHLSQITSNWWVFPLFLMALLASVAPFVYMRLQKRFEARLRAEEFKTHEALRRLSHNMLRFTNLNVLLRLIVHYLVKILRLNFASIYLFDSQTNKYLLSSLWHSGIERPNLPDHFELDDYLIELLYLKRTPILREELSIYAPNAFTERIKKLFFFLSKSEINIIIPSFLRNYLIGFVVLSDRKNRIPFSQEDINLLMVLSNEAALAIENAQFHQRELSSILESSRREALADMAPGASHQFNNRLAAISSSVELLLYKLESLNDKDPQNGTIKDALSDIKATLNMINQEVYKGKEITSAILKRAKAKVEFQEFNIINLIDNAYKLVMISHAHSDRDKLKEIRFRIDSFKKDVTILASEALLQDVFYNLIDNSCDAIQEKARLIKEGGLEEDSNFIGLIEILLRQEDSTLIIQIKDDGIGLTKENLRKLFTPYFTTKATSNKGSGLGLCVIRDFIEMHKGSIVCESEYTKGTTFTIRLPMGKESHYKVEKV